MSQHIGDLQLVATVVALMLLCISVVACLFYASETSRSSYQSFPLNAVKVIATFIGLFATVPPSSAQSALGLTR